jgi:hypothetical protein
MVSKTRLDKYITHAMKTYNTGIHEVTEFKPHDLISGGAERISTSNILPDDNDNESYPEYATALFKCIYDARSVSSRKS